MKYKLNKLNGKYLVNLYGVYKVTNIKTKDFYIGSGILRNRYNSYRSYFNKKNNNYSWLWENNNKLEDFQFEVIELHKEYNEPYLKEREQYYFDTFNPSLNKSKNSKTPLYLGRLTASKNKTNYSINKLSNIIENWSLKNMEK